MDGRRLLRLPSKVNNTLILQLSFMAVFICVTPVIVPIIGHAAAVLLAKSLSKMNIVLGANPSDDVDNRQIRFTKQNLTRIQTHFK